MNEYDITANLSLKTIKEVTEIAVKSITQNNWESYMNYIQKEWIVTEIWINGGRYSFVISVGGIESSNEVEDSSNSGEEYESLSKSEPARTLSH